METPLVTRPDKPVDNAAVSPEGITCGKITGICENESRSPHFRPKAVIFTKAAALKCPKSRDIGKPDQR